MRKTVGQTVFEWAESKRHKMNRYIYRTFFTKKKIPGGGMRIHL